DKTHEEDKNYSEGELMSQSEKSNLKEIITTEKSMEDNTESKDGKATHKTRLEITTTQGQETATTRVLYQWI
ncbi:10909_t:CDS:2, partial [Gigaspora margarita]